MDKGNMHRYKLDGLFAGLLDRSFFQQRGKIVREPSNLDAAINYYDVLLREFSKSSYGSGEFKFDMSPLRIDPDSVRKGRDQVFTKLIDFPDDEYYIITWDVTKAIAIIKRDEITPQRFKVCDVFKDTEGHHSELNQSYVPQAARNDEPIIMVSFPIAESITHCVVIDGSHRVYGKYQTGIKEIDAYLLKPSQSIQAMMTDLDRILYTIHHNITWISDYMLGYSSLDHALRMLIPI